MRRLVNGAIWNQDDDDILCDQKLSLRWEASLIASSPYFSDHPLKALIESVPGFAICLIEGLKAKGRCYTAFAQTLRTRSVIERLAQPLLDLGGPYGCRENDAIAIEDMISHDKIASLVCSTRHWVTIMLKRFRNDGS